MQRSYEIIYVINTNEYCITDSELEFNEDEQMPDVIKGTYDANSLVYKNALEVVKKECEKKNLTFVAIIKIYPLTNYEIII